MVSPSSLNCFSLPSDHDPVMELVEGVLQKKLDHWLGIVFGEEYPFLGTESDGQCSQEKCDMKYMKVLGNFSGPFQIEVSFQYKCPGCYMIIILRCPLCLQI